MPVSPPKSESKSAGSSADAANRTLKHIPVRRMIDTLYGAYLALFPNMPT
jgi:hypothetical protein